jgi:AAA ATPase domain
VASDLVEERLRTARHRAFVGRKEELAAFDEALCRGGVLFVHGPGGVGKSALLGNFAQRAEEAGRTVLVLDGRLLDPAAFTASVFDVLLIDSFERLQGLESWLRDRFLPTLPVGTLVVVAGRMPPDLTWQADPGWADLLRVVALGELDPMDAAALLDARGVAAELRDPLLAFAGGHPLALSLGAAATSTREVVATLLDQLVGDVPSPAHRQALEVCAHTYRSTEDVLRAVLPDEDAAALFDWLRRLPFVDSRQLGLSPHDVVRAIVEADLRWRDPTGYADLHRRVKAHVTRQIRDAEDTQVLGAVGALFYLHRDTHSWRGEDEIDEDAFRPEDAEELSRLTEAGALHWMAQQPAAFRLYRRDGELVGAGAWLRVDSEAAARADPLVAKAWATAHAKAPLRPGEHLAVYRTWVRPWDTSPVTRLIRWRAVGWILRSERLAWSFTADTPAHDWRAVPAQVWLDRLLSGGAPHEPELAVLSQAEFTEAVRKALRHLSRHGELAANPLTRSRLLAGRTDPVKALRELLEEAIRDLGRDPRAGKPHRALDVTYLRGAPTQEAAAERLGLSFTTYRRHLTTGIEHLCAALWRRELHGVG